MEQTHNPTYKKNKQIKHTTFWALVFLVICWVLLCCWLVVLILLYCPLGLSLGFSWVVVQLLLCCYLLPFVLLLNSSSVFGCFCMVSWFFSNCYLILFALLSNFSWVRTQFLLGLLGLLLRSYCCCSNVLLLLGTLNIVVWLHVVLTYVQAHVPFLPSIHVC